MPNRRIWNTKLQGLRCNMELNSYYGCSIQTRDKIRRLHTHIFKRSHATINNLEDSQGEEDKFKACSQDYMVVDVEDSRPTCKLVRTHFQYFLVTCELKRKKCKAHPHHRANKKKRKK
ncbi:MAG: hypothetical protein EZS28_049029 [Streblomastix strix]|uniref:Uncharacterized protein n=1 Tax=Streblomastix strix TaxID=222440 RepID=A0A5J4TAP5_9EUKA|nr:MAG: hypothetical protein EZS28_049029 [Streblomastix strix]